MTQAASVVKESVAVKHLSFRGTLKSNQRLASWVLQSPMEPDDAPILATVLPNPSNSITWRFPQKRMLQSLHINMGDHDQVSGLGFYLLLINVLKA